MKTTVVSIRLDNDDLEMIDNLCDFFSSRLSMECNRSMIVKNALKSYNNTLKDYIEKRDK